MELQILFELIIFFFLEFLYFFAKSEILGKKLGEMILFNYHISLKFFNEKKIQKMNSFFIYGQFLVFLAELN